MSDDEGEYYIINVEIVEDNINSDTNWTPAAAGNKDDDSVSSDDIIIVLPIIAVNISIFKYK